MHYIYFLSELKKDLKHEFDADLAHDDLNILSKMAKRCRDKNDFDLLKKHIKKYYSEIQRYNSVLAEIDHYQYSD